MMNNKQKNRKYANLMYKLSRSIQNEYYYESIFIEYAILEDRTESILRHANLTYISRNGKPLSLFKKLNKISKTVRLKNDKYFKKHISKKLVSQIHLWKNERNTLIHNLINTEYNNEKIKTVSLKGYELVKVLNSKSKLVNKHLDELKNGHYN